MMNRTETANRTFFTGRWLRRSLKIFIFIFVFFMTLELMLHILFLPSFEHLKIIRKDNYRLIALKPSSEASPPVSIVATLFSKSAKDTYQVGINPQGLRSDRTYSRRERKGIFRVLCLGDSITYGWGLDLQYTYPSLLEKYLGAFHPGADVEVINAGCPGYSSRQGYIYLDRELGEFHPQMMIVQFGFNDGYPGITTPLTLLRPLVDKEVMIGSPGDFKPIQGDLLTWVDSGLKKSAVVQIVMAGISTSIVLKQSLAPQGGDTSDNINQKEPWIKSRESVQDFARNLEWFAEWAEREKVTLIFIDSWPTQLQYRKAMRRVASQRGITLCSQYNIIEKVRSNPEEIIHQKRFEEFLKKSMDRFGPERLSESPELYVLVDNVHPNEIANILLVEELLKQ